MRSLGALLPGSLGFVPEVSSSLSVTPSLSVSGSTLGIVVVDTSGAVVVVVIEVVSIKIVGVEVVAEELVVDTDVEVIDDEVIGTVVVVSAVVVCTVDDGGL